MSDELAYLTIAQAARLIRQEELSPLELTRTLLARIGRLDPALNAFITLMPEAAMEAAARAERELNRGIDRGPLQGIPLAVKDLFATAGVRTTAGSRVLEDNVPEEDAAVVTRLASAGAVPLGKLHTTEFAYSGTGANAYFGPCHNPWNPERMPGGSSSGSGAAVAAGLCLGALGSDTGGSVRLPAAYCGVVGLKPTYGRISRQGAVTLAWSLDHAGPLTRTVEDTALLLQVLAGPDSSDASTLSAPQPPDYRASLSQELSGLRLGLERGAFWTQLQPGVERAATAALDVLRDQGAELFDVELPSLAMASAALRTIIFAEAAAYHSEWLQTRRESYSPETRNLLELGLLVPAADYLRAQQARTRLLQEVQAVFDQVDALVLPTAPFTAPPLGSSRVEINGVMESIATFQPRWTGPFNLTGLPALSVPCGFDSEGLPIGLQIVGPAWAEPLVLKIGYAYEQATEWHRRRPSLEA